MKRAGALPSHAATRGSATRIRRQGPSPHRRSRVADARESQEFRPHGHHRRKRSRVPASRERPSSWKTRPVETSVRRALTASRSPSTRIRTSRSSSSPFDIPTWPPRRRATPPWQPVRAPRCRRQTPDDMVAGEEAVARMKGVVARQASRAGAALSRLGQRAKTTIGLLAKRGRRPDEAASIRRTTSPPLGGGLHATGRRVVRGDGAVPAAEEGATPPGVKMTRRKAAVATAVMLAAIVGALVLKKSHHDAAPEVASTTAHETPASVAPSAAASNQPAPSAMPAGGTRRPTAPPQRHTNRTPRPPPTTTRMPSRPRTSIMSGRRRSATGPSTTAMCFASRWTARSR